MNPTPKKKVWFKLNQRRGFFEKIIVHDVWKFQGVNLKGWDLAFLAEFPIAKTNFEPYYHQTTMEICRQHPSILNFVILDDEGDWQAELKKPIIVEDQNNFLYYAKDGFLRIELLGNWWMKGYDCRDLARYDTEYVKEIIIPTIKEYKPDTIEGVDNLLSGWFGINKIPF